MKSCPKVAHMNEGSVVEVDQGNDTCLCEDWTFEGLTVWIQALRKLLWSDSSTMAKEILQVHIQ